VRARVNVRGLMKADIGIIGAGVMGLWLALKLAQRGYSVAVIEKEPWIADGPSTRNEGWLHCGAYHAAAIVDRSLAMQVAYRTREGFKQTLAFAPESVEDAESRTFALVGEERLEEVTSRWEEAGVVYRPALPLEFNALDSQINVRSFKGVFAVQDLSIDTRVLYTKLVAAAQLLGVTFLRGTRVAALANHVAVLESPAGGPDAIAAQAFVFATGYRAMEAFESLLHIRLPMRFFRSHLLDVPRLGKHGLFGVEPGQATIMNHGNWSIVGLNKDQEQVTDASFDPVDTNIEAVKAALSRLMPRVDFTRCYGRACLKVDIDPCATGFANLNVAFGEPVAGYFWVLPGKMTEAPFAADVVVEALSERMGSPRTQPIRRPKWSHLLGTDPPVAPRPIDTYDTIGPK